jgi:hypothetical protein
VPKDVAVAIPNFVFFFFFKKNKIIFFFYIFFTTITNFTFLPNITHEVNSFEPTNSSCESIYVFLLKKMQLNSVGMMDFTCQNFNSKKLGI